MRSLVIRYMAVTAMLCCTLAAPLGCLAGSEASTENGSEANTENGSESNIGELGHKPSSSPAQSQRKTIQLAGAAGKTSNRTGTNASRAAKPEVRTYGKVDPLKVISAKKNKLQTK